MRGRGTQPALAERHHQRSVQREPGPGDTPSRRRIFVCRPAQRVADEPACAQADSLDAGAPGLPASGDRCGSSPTLLPFYDDRPRRRRISIAAFSAALERLLVSPQFLFRIERDPAGRGAGIASSRQRSGTGLAPVVLPVEQHSRRRAAGRRRRRAS